MVSWSWSGLRSLLVVILILGMLAVISACTSGTATTATTLTTTTATTTTATTTQTTTTTTTTSTSVVSFSRDIQPIFDANCVICHQGGIVAGGRSLEPGVAYRNLVNVPSSQSPLMLVAPGAPSQSYLLNKLLGTQGQVGGSGARMPYGAPPLPQAQINLIQQWIVEGAPNN